MIAISRLKRAITDTENSTGMQTGTRNVKLPLMDAKRLVIEFDTLNNEVLDLQALLMQEEEVIIRLRKENDELKLAWKALCEGVSKTMSEV